MARMNGGPSPQASSSASMSVDYVVESKRAEEMLERLETLLGPAMLGAFMAGPVVQHFQNKFTEYFEAEAGPEGPWVPLADATIADREAKGFGPGPINQRTGELRSFIAESPGDVRVLSTLAVLVYPGNIPSGELGRKVRTAQQGGTFKGHAVPARQVMAADESDLLYIMSALTFFLELS